MDNTLTNSILAHHLTAFGNNDVEEIIKDYTDKSEILTVDGIVKGLPNIRKFFIEVFRLIPAGSELEMKQQIQTENLAYIVWRSQSHTAEIPLGTDTFVFEGEKIIFHSLAFINTKQ